jgi:hypothetical protein
MVGTFIHVYNNFAWKRSGVPTDPLSFHLDIIFIWGQTDTNAVFYLSGPLRDLSNVGSAGLPAGSDREARRVNS